MFCFVSHDLLDASTDRDRALVDHSAGSARRSISEGNPKLFRSQRDWHGGGVPKRASAAALLAFIAMVPRTLEGRQGLRPDVSAVTLSAVRGRIAADREGGRRRNEERGREANHRNCLIIELLLLAWFIFIAMEGIVQA